MTSDDLQKKRDAIRKIDQTILELARERTHLARDVGNLKATRGLPLRNFEVEAEVIAEARRHARDHGLKPALAEGVMQLLIADAVSAQEADRRDAAGARERSGQRALVIGGRGNMGAWFTRYLDGKGMSVTVSDPAGPLADYPFEADWRGAASAFDLVLVATPPSVVRDVLTGLAGETQGLVVEISSLKSPLLKELAALKDAGATVASLHPMWGPQAELLANKNLVVCDTGDPEASRAGRALFEDTAARIVELPVDEHDAFMAFTLGLPHAINLAFSHVLHEAPYAERDLAHFGGPTWTKQSRVAAEVVHENKDLYYEIQHLNVHTPDVFRCVRASLDALEQAIGKRDTFLAFMRECEAYFERPNDPTAPGGP